MIQTDCMFTTDYECFLEFHCVEEGHHFPTKSVLDFPVLEYPDSTTPP